MLFLILLKCNLVSAKIYFKSRKTITLIFQKNNLVYIVTSVLLFFSTFLFAQDKLNQTNSVSDPLLAQDALSQKLWVDFTIKNMTLRQKIGQLFMVAAYSNKDDVHRNEIQKLINDYEIGGLIFMQGTPTKQAELTNLYQSKSKTPLLIAFDGEWGLDMRLDNTYRYPWNMTLGAIRDNKLIEELGVRIAQQHKRLGIHVNFAPVVDINTNPKNPIIGNRSYGEHMYNVTNKALAFTKGLQSQNVLACAKHFPGHGDTDMDSHKTLPSVLFDAKRIDSIELFPYKKLIENELGSVMTAHLSIPSLEPDGTLPTSLSPKVINAILKQQLGFKGLIFTDALNMKGASNFATEGEIDLMAFLAGNDVLLFSGDVPKAVQLFEKAVAQKQLSEVRIDESVRKILKTKYWAGLNRFEKIKTTKITEELNTKEDDVLHKKLVDASVTLIKRSDVFPIVDLQQKIAYVKLGEAPNDAFVNTLKKYTQIDQIYASNTKDLLIKLKKYDLVIMGFHKSNANPWKSYKFSASDLQLLKEVSDNNKVILSVFASPYSLNAIEDFQNIEAIIIGYQNSKFAQEITAQKIFGALETKGKLPVSIKKDFKEGFGLFSNSIERLTYGIPEEVGVDSEKLKAIDSIANVVIKEKMAPGVQVLVARHGTVIYHKKFGYHTYQKKRELKLSDSYDLASLTKILGGLPIFMKAEEEGKYKLDDHLGKLFPMLKNTNKDTIIIRKALAHYGQLIPWIPYYINTLDSVTKKPLPMYYKTAYSDDFNIKITENLYLRSDYQDTIYKRIAKSDLREKNNYRYSGLLFYLVKKYAQDTYGEDMATLNSTLFYEPLGAKSLTYNPLFKYAQENIVPTEKDDYFRHKLLQGTVHDMGAAMMDGVSGNAGLFGNANDIAKMMQMYLQKGFYGGKRYFNSTTIDKFNTRYYETDKVRRGLGFDKPFLNPDEDSSCGCSEQSFGHGGFTGTYAWVDPEADLVYIFLSNRVYPKMNNRKLYKENIRPKIFRVIQDAIID